jgi:hypothetical protein
MIIDRGEHVSRMTFTELQRPGVYRRHFRLHSDNGIVHAAMEDDSHCFGLILKHDGTKVRSIEGIPIRTPWNLCSGATHVLGALIDTQLNASPLIASSHVDAKQQCTHLFDLAVLAIAHALRPIGSREYQIEAPWYELSAPRTMTLKRNGVLISTWVLAGDKLITPEPLAEIGVRKLLAWAALNIHDADALEALFIMRRAALISMSRIMDLDQVPNPEATGHGLGACYVHQPGRISIATRNLGSTLDFSDRPEDVLKGFELSGFKTGA